MIKRSKEYENIDENAIKKKKIKSTDEYIDDLTEHFELREKMMKIHGKHIETGMSKEEKIAMEYLFDYLIKVTKMDDISDSDDIIKYTEHRKKAAIREKWKKVLEKFEKAIKNKKRSFNIGFFFETLQMT